MGFLFDLFGELFIVVVIAVAFGAWEYVAFRTSKRVWMWIAGLAGIAVVIWFKGHREMWSWMLGVGWLAVLAYCDWLLHQRAQEPPEVVATAAAPVVEPISPVDTGRRY
jgi:peptidoglycan/LPS O-acetylase OafA/YrhL